MFNPIRKLFVSHQKAVEETASIPVVREDFTLYDVDKMTVRQILDVLRRDTIEFAEDNRLAWAATDFIIHNVPVRVKLTEAYDIVYVVDSETIFNPREAINAIKAQSVQF